MKVAPNLRPWRVIMHNFLIYLQNTEYCMDKACHYPKMFHVTWFFPQVDGCPWPQDIHAHTKAGVPMSLSLSCPGWQQHLPRVIPCAQDTNSAPCFVWFSHFSHTTNVIFQVAAMYCWLKWTDLTSSWWPNQCFLFCSHFWQINPLKTSSFLLLFPKLTTLWQPSSCGSVLMPWEAKAEARQLKE